VTLRVILDSNFLFLPFQFKIDVLEELKTLLNRQFEPVVLSVTREEIQRIASKGGVRTRSGASLALRLAEKCRVVDVEHDVRETSDDVILRIAKEWECPVATNDRSLRRRLRDINLPVIYLRQKSRLELEGSI